MKKSKVIGYIPLMYGAEYLKECIKSMEPWVEKILIVYTDKPSQGHATEMQCPETEQQLQEIAFTASNKVEWHKKYFCFEGEHRAYIFNFTKGYDLVFTLDADEVVEEKDIEKALQLAFNSDKRNIGITTFIHFWRSFNYYLIDSYTPCRIINLHNKKGTENVNCRIYHFSTAQQIDIIRFKWTVSGHKDELRANWIDDIYLNWKPEDEYLHPVSLDIWGKAQFFDKTTLPQILKEHPNYNKKLI